MRPSLKTSPGRRQCGWQESRSGPASDARSWSQLCHGLVLSAGRPSSGRRISGCVPSRMPERQPVVPVSGKEAQTAGALYWERLFWGSLSHPTPRPRQPRSVPVAGSARSPAQRLTWHRWEVSVASIHMHGCDQPVAGALRRGWPREDSRASHTDPRESPSAAMHFTGF